MMATNPFNLATPQPVGTPFLANNGNPNTVYNSTATPIQSFGSQPLMHNAAAVGAVLPEPWASTPVFNPNPGTQLPPVALPANSAFANPQAQFWRNLSGVQRPVFDLSTSGVSNPNASWVPVPPGSTTPPATTPPATTPPGTRPGTGGPASEQGGWSDLGPGAWSPGVIGSNNGGTSLITENGNFTLNPINSIVSGLNGIVDSAASGLGFNGADGSFDVNQFLDAVSEVFLPGDLYNQNVESWNSLNVVNSLLNSVVPGLGNLAQWLVDKLPEGNALRSWMQRNVLQNNADEAKDPDNFMNAPQGGREETNPFNNPRQYTQGPIGNYGGGWGGYSGTAQVGSVEQV